MWKYKTKFIQDQFGNPYPELCLMWRSPARLRPKHIPTNMAAYSHLNTNSHEVRLTTAKVLWPEGLKAKTAAGRDAGFLLTKRSMWALPQGQTDKIKLSLSFLFQTHTFPACFLFRLVLIVFRDQILTHFLFLHRSTNYPPFPLHL